MESRTIVRRSATEGARAVVPILLSVAPLAVVLGVTISRSAVDRVGAWAASFLLCAGTAQLSAVELLDRRAAPLAIIGTVLLINSRYAVYSAGLAVWFADEPLWRRLLLAFPLVDQLYALCAARFAAAPLDRRERRAYYLGAAGVLVMGWSTVQALALVFAAWMPDLHVLALASPLAFVGLLAGALRDRASITAAAVGGCSTVALAATSPRLGLLVGAVAGLLAGCVIEGRSS